MSDYLDMSGLGRVADGLRRLVNPDATPLMVRWMAIIDEDNRKGVLAGLDKDGVPMVPVTYRPIKPGPIKPTKDQRGGKRANARKGDFLGLQAKNFGNLTTSEYRRLGGPPLAPRDQFSRVITNLYTAYGRTGPVDMQWYAMGYWDEVVSKKGVPFLRFHFDGTAKLPRRDLRGVRPAGRAKALDAMKAWAKDLVRQAFGRNY